MKPISLLRYTTVVALGYFGSLSQASAQEFFYNGDSGPGFWSGLSAEWEACAGAASDARQSPIDVKRVRVDKKLRALDLETFPTSIDIFNNGHTIEQHYEGTGTSIAFEGRSYELQQFHFHTLSEHTIAGRHGAMELHAVFQEPESGDHLVLAMLYETGKRSNPFIQRLIDAGLPEKDGDTTVTGDQIDLADALTDTRSYYTYAGSLTTPPCSETVTWVILAKPAKLSHAQFEAFRDILGNNFRPLQDPNDRTIRASVSAVAER